MFSYHFYNKMKEELERRIGVGEISIPDASTPIEVDPEAKLTFAVFGDSQVSNYMFARESCFWSACLDIKNMKSNLDALMIVGDIAENGLASEYMTTARMLNSISDKVDNFVLMPGNHDVRLRNYEKQHKRFRNFETSVKNAVVCDERHYYHSFEIKGYKFIVMGTDSATFEGAYISDEQIEWLDKEIASTKDSGKPVFVLNHQTLKKTNGLPYTWLGKGSWRGSIGNQSKKVLDVFEKYDNVIFITGHLHFGTCQHTYENYGTFKAISVPTVSASNHGEYNADSQGLVFSVYDNKMVVRSREFGNGKYSPDEVYNSEFTIRW